MIKFSSQIKKHFSSYLIKNGKVVTSNQNFLSDVLIRDGCISSIGQCTNIPAGTQTIDASDKLVIPGGIDTHTHMQLPFMGTYAIDDF